MAFARRFKILFLAILTAAVLAVASVRPAPPTLPPVPSAIDRTISTIAAQIATGNLAIENNAASQNPAKPATLTLLGVALIGLTIARRKLRPHAA